MAGERRNQAVPVNAQAAAKYRAACAEARATNKATSAGPTMKIDSISSDSSE